MQKNGVIVRNYVILIIIFIVFTNVGKNASGRTLQEMRAQGVPEVSAAELFNSFDDNPVAVVNRYATTGVMITGIVYYIGLNNWGEPYISMKIGDDEENSITFYFTKYHIKRIADIKKNVTITICGYPQDKVYKNGYNIAIMSNCSIVDANPPQQK